MGCRILSDRRAGTACWYDSVTDTAFGPLAHDGPGYDAEQVLERAADLVRRYAIPDDRSDDARTWGLDPHDPRALSPAALETFALAATRLLDAEVWTPDDSLDLVAIRTARHAPAPNKRCPRCGARFMDVHACPKGGRFS